MDIKTFVAETLTQIIEGVELAQSKTGFSTINPAFGKAAPDPTKENLVEFDIAVTLERGKETEGGLKIGSGLISLGSRGKSNRSDSSVNRIKFSVPIAFCMSQKWPAKR